jgi:hypothetical protein
MVADQLRTFQVGRQQMEEMSTVGQAYPVSNPKTAERVENAVHDNTHQTICSVNQMEYEHTYCTSHHTNLGTSQQDVFPVGPTATDTRSIHWYICRVSYWG